MSTSRLLLLVVLSGSILQADTAKILMIPLNINSHVLYFARLAEGLSKLGHDIELIVPSNNPSAPRSDPANNLTVTIYKVESDMPIFHTREVSANFFEVATTKSPLTKMYRFIKYQKKTVESFIKDCEDLLGNRELMKRIEDAGFDFAIMDPFAANCYLLIPHSMNIPYASMSLPVMSLLYRVPRLPSFSANPATSAYSDEMSFIQRLNAFVFQELAINVYYLDSTNYFADKYFPEKNITLRSSYELLRKSSLFFYLEDLTLGYPRPHMPNTVSIGDLMVKDPGQPIPPNLDKFIDDSPDGAIVVCLGSYLDYIPEYVSTKLCEAFQRVKYSVIWKSKNETMCRHSPNVLILPWIPQNDLLAHRKVRALITHGGLNSMMEAIYHAKPVIVFPFVTDQPGNADTAVRKGYGVRMDIAAFSADELVVNIKRVVNEPGFARNIGIASAMLKDRPDSPAERVSNLINHVVKHGDQHLRTKAFDLWLFQYLLFDIFVFLLFLFALLLIVTGCCLFKIFSFTKNLFGQQRKKKLA